MKKIVWSLGCFILICTTFLSGCGSESRDKTDGYECLIGVSLINVMEPWLNNFEQVLAEKAEGNPKVNLIFQDAAGSTEKQIQDIQLLMECGIDLLILSPDGSDALNEVLKDTFSEIPVVVVGVEPESEAYTTFIRTDDEGIGEMAGNYILDQLYENEDNVVVIQGVDGSPISEKRLKGFQKAIDGKISDDKIFYYYGDWIRDRAELRMKDYLVVNNTADTVVFGLNDEMAYGAYLACQQLRVNNKMRFIGVDGFEGEIAGRNMVEKGILDATIQTPDFAELAYRTSMEILEGKSVERDITIVPNMVLTDD
ncbi:MAG: substrate-binding domain-containing protein [Eubacteriales bacterium]|nr:substrate-binding domain-containing protein [Eubacteriales bacterium]